MGLLRGYDTRDESHCVEYGLQVFSDGGVATAARFSSMQVAPSRMIDAVFECA